MFKTARKSSISSENSTIHGNNKTHSNSSSQGNTSEERVNNSSHERENTMSAASVLLDLMSAAKAVMLQK